MFKLTFQRNQLEADADHIQLPKR